jgi:hypothetical protein
MTSLNLNIIITYLNSSTDFREGVQSCYSSSTFDEILKDAMSLWVLPCHNDSYDVQLRKHDDTEDHMKVEAQSQLCNWLDYFCRRGPIIEFLLDKIESNKEDVINNTNERNSALHKTDEFEQLFAGNIWPIIGEEHLDKEVDTFFQDVLGSSEPSEIDYSDEVEEKEESIPFSISDKSKLLLTPLFPPGIPISELGNIPGIWEDKLSPIKDENIELPSAHDNTSFSIPMRTNNHNEFVSGDPSIISVPIKSSKNKYDDHINGNYDVSISGNKNIKYNDIEDVEKEFSEQEELSGDESDGHLTSNQNPKPRVLARIEPNKLTSKVDDDRLFNTELENFKVHIRNNGGIISLSKIYYLTKEWPELARLLKKRYSKVHGINTMTQIFLDNECLGVKVLPAFGSKPLRYCLSETSNLDMKFTSDPSAVKYDLDLKQSICSSTKSQSTGNEGGSPANSLLPILTSIAPLCPSVSDSHTILNTTSPDTLMTSIRSCDPTPVAMSPDNSSEISSPISSSQNEVSSSFSPVSNDIVKKCLSGGTIQNYGKDVSKNSNHIDNMNKIIDKIDSYSTVDDGNGIIMSEINGDESDNDIKGVTKKINGLSKAVQIYTHPITGLQRSRKWDSDEKCLLLQKEGAIVSPNPSPTEQPTDHTSQSNDQRLRDRVRNILCKDRGRGSSTDPHGGYIVKDRGTYYRHGRERGKKRSTSMSKNKTQTSGDTCKDFRGHERKILRRSRDMARDLKPRSRSRSRDRDRSRDKVRDRKSRSRSRSRDRDRDRRPRSRG